MGIDAIGSTGPGEEKAYCRGSGAIEWDQVRVGLADQPRQTSLPGWTTHGLRQRSGWNRYSHTALLYAGEQSDYPAVIAIKGDQSACIEGDALHAALPLRTPRRLGAARIPSAQSRSFLVSGPPVCASAS